MPVYNRIFAKTVKISGIMEETAVERALLYIEPGPVVLVTTFDRTFVADGETYNCRELMLSKLPPGL